MGKSVEFLSPEGRLVQGSVFEPQTKNKLGQLLVDKNNNPAPVYIFSLAVPKNSPQWPAFRALVDQTAQAAFPQFFQNVGGVWQCTLPTFAFKIMDGDGFDGDGKPNSTKEGFAGHWIIKFKSNYAPKCYAFGHYQPHEQLTDPKSIPRGFYVQVAGTMVSNEGASPKPGIFMNGSLVQLIRGEVKDIMSSGPDAAAVFGGTARPGGAPMPPGAAPAVSGPQMTPKANGVPYAQFIAQGWTDAMLIEQQYMLPSAPVAPVAPVMQQAPAVPLPPTQVAPHPGILSGPQMTPKANGVPYAQFIAQGWTDAMLIEQQYMLPSAPAPLGIGGSAPPGPPPAPTAGAPLPPTIKRMTPQAGAFTYEQYIAQGYTDAMLVQNGLMYP